jgi:hypothetical protein
LVRGLVVNDITTELELRVFFILTARQRRPMGRSRDGKRACRGGRAKHS